MNIYKEIAQVLDADFRPADLNAHYERHTTGGHTPIPSGMSKEEYGKKAKEVSLKNVSSLTDKNRKVRAYKRQGGVICKTDGKWFVSYSGGKNGKLNTAFPADVSYFERRMNEENGTEIFFE